MKNLFRFDGRINRRDWWIATICNSTVAFVCYLALVLLLDSFSSGFMSLVTLLVLLAVAIVASWISLSLGIRRWHDVGKSGWWVLISAVPFGGLYALYKLGIDSGEPGSNEYGLPPDDGAAWSDPPSITFSSPDLRVN